MARNSSHLPKYKCFKACSIYMIQKGTQKYINKQNKEVHFHLPGCLCVSCLLHQGINSPAGKHGLLFSIGDFPPDPCKTVCPCSALSEQGLATTVASKLGQLCWGQVFMLQPLRRKMLQQCMRKKLQLFCQTCAHARDYVIETAGYFKM